MSGFHLLIYDGSSAGPTTNFDLTAAVDPIFTQRNGHYTLTDVLKLIAVQAMSPAPTRFNIKTPTWNAQTIFNVDPLQESVTQLSPPRIMNLWDYQPTIPQDEEIQVQGSDPTVAASVYTAGLFIGTPDINMNIPKGMPPLAVFSARVTITTALTARAFCPLSIMTFEQGLRAGIYAVVGAKFYIASGLFFRIQFPRSTLYNGRALRPGDLVSNAAGDQQWYTPINLTTPFGVWGKFHTFELPQVEVWSSATVGSATYEGRLMLVKLSENPDPGMLGV
jgi:hypothetical protein